MYIYIYILYVYIYTYIYTYIYVHIYINQVVSSKHIFLSFKPLYHQLIKGPNKQKSDLLFLRFDILSLSKILFFRIEFAIP